MQKPKAPSAIKQRQLRNLSVTVKLLSSQLGGGAVAKQVAPDQWLRPAAVRGALRFWWRAINSPRFVTIDELRTHEIRIFGAAATEQSGPGACAVLVYNQQLGRTSEYNFTPDDPKGVAYFPGQGMGGSKSRLLESGTATIRVVEVLGRSEHSRSDDDWSELKQALVAFILFGGSGSRSRKTAGSIALSSPPPDELRFPATVYELGAWFAALPKGAPPAKLFSLGEAELFYRRTDQAGILGMWRGFRQDRQHPSNWRGRTGWGRTRWPEADALRFVHGVHARWADGTTHAPEQSNQGKVPRAHLGLPIIVKFQHNRATNEPHPQRGRLLSPEPSRSEIGDRYASPVVLSLTLVGEKMLGLVLITPSTLNSVERISIKHTNTALSPGRWLDVKSRLLNHLKSNSFARIGEQP